MSDACGPQVGSFQNPMSCVGLARMHGDAQPPFQGQVQGRSMVSGGEAEFGPCQVKTHHSVSPITRGQCGSRPSAVSAEVPHATHDETTGQRAVGQAAQHGFEGAFRWQAPIAEQLRGKPELRQHAAVAVGVFAQFAGHALARCRVGHGGHGVLEALEVADQLALECVGVHPQAGIFCTGPRQRYASRLAQLPQCVGAQTAVDVFVQAHLGKGLPIGGQWCWGVGCHNGHLSRIMW